MAPPTDPDSPRQIPSSLPPPNPPPAQRAIRAHVPRPGHITVYQAYSPTIASAALTSQSLSASSDFNPNRTTWIKPSWCWMMYRCGYTYKDARQARVLALTMRIEDFWGLLARAVVSEHAAASEGRKRERGKEVVVQWDPERDVRLGRLPWRSLQVGVPPVLVPEWAGGMVVQIEDATERARELKRVLDGDQEVGVEELVARGLVPVEEELVVPEDVRERLGMD